MKKCNPPTLLTRHAIAAFCRAKRIGFNEIDVHRVQRYLRGPQTCERYDRLDTWVRMIVDELAKDPDLSRTLGTD
jgi:hypothetical protein